MVRNMDFRTGLAIVRDLANENVLEESYAEDSILKQERREQLEAVDIVDEFLTLLRGHNL